MPRTAKPDVKPAPVPTSPAAAPAEEEEPSLEEYERHRAEVLANLPAEDLRPKNIYARLAQILGYVGQIRKTGRNTFHNYRYAKEADLVEAIRPILSAYGIWIEQGLHGDPELGFVAHQRLSQTKKDRAGNVTGEQETLTAITKRFRFVWWNPERVSTDTNAKGVLEVTEWTPFMGYGDDNSDKGYNKAETSAVKYFLMKTFMVATGDDPEGDSKADQRAAARDATTNVEVRGRQGGRQAAPGGRQQDASTPQLKTVGDLLGQLNARQAVVAIPLVEELTGLKAEIDPDDIPGSFVKFMQEMKPEVVGKLIYDLRKRVEALPAAGKEETREPVDDGSHQGDAVDGVDPAAPDADDGTVSSEA